MIQAAPNKMLVLGLIAIMAPIVWGLCGTLSLTFGASGQVIQQSRQTEESTSPTFTERELSAFAKAYVKVTRIRTNYGPRISMAKNREQADQLRDARDQEIRKILEETGITKDIYDQIFEAFSNDDRVRKRVNQFLVQ